MRAPKEKLPDIQSSNVKSNDNFRRPKYKRFSDEDILIKLFDLKFKLEINK